jgi:hypothetical protein
MEAKIEYSLYLFIRQINKKGRAFSDPAPGLCQLNIDRIKVAYIDLLLCCSPVRSPRQRAAH